MGTDKRARQKELSRTRAEEARKEAAALARRKRFVTIGSVTVVLALLIAGAIALGGDDDSTDAADSPTTTAAADATTVAPGETTTTTAFVEAEPGSAECPKADGSSDRKDSFDGPPKMCIDAAKKYTAKVATSEGDFEITLDAAKAPKTVNNFVFLSRYHFYDSLIFHRIIKDFMFQGGDPQGTGMGGPGYDFGDELPQAGEYQKYSVAMANSGPNTNGSQFFVITGDQGVGLPPSYSLFGQVTSGTDVADKIGLVETATGDKPVKDVTIEKVTIEEK
ncbi:MAG: peptidylprolyl isomerase [Microthrixaceae bacterium]|jgi:cyclophilin family peptidyl-prolyl cis-trans isomerase